MREGDKRNVVEAMEEAKPAQEATTEVNNLRQKESLLISNLYCFFSALITYLMKINH